MAQPEISPLFIERDPDNYILTSEESVVFGAAWQVLQAFDRGKNGTLKLYTDDNRESTIDYLRDGGEERPLNIFVLMVQESFQVPNQFNLWVGNNNGRGNPEYQQTLRNAVEAVGVEASTDSGV